MTPYRFQKEAADKHFLIFPPWRDRDSDIFIWARGEVMKKILVVDDEENLRELYKQELLDEGYSVILAANGKEALTLIEHESPDLVVLDIRMPEMNGIETLGKMVGKFKKIPIILNTAYSSYKENFRSWAAEAYVVKSSDLSELKEKIKEVLTKKGE